MPSQSLTLPIPKAPLMFIDIEAGSNQAYIWLISVLIDGKPDSLRLFYAETPEYPDMTPRPISMKLHNNARLKKAVLGTLLTL